MGWLLGFLGDVSWSELKWVFATTVIGLVPLFWIRHALDGMLLGEDSAAATGIDIRRTQYIVLGCTSLLVAGAVAFAGLIGFIGLIVPHMIRLVIGPRHNWLFYLQRSLGLLF